MNYIKRKSALQEKRTAKNFKGKTQIASGALYFAKSDVRTGGDRTSGFNETDFLIENKFTDKDFYSLQKSIWEKVEREALNENFRTPLMQIDIGERNPLRLVVIGYNDYIGFRLEEELVVYDVYLTSERKSVKLTIKDWDIIQEEATKQLATPVLFLHYLDKATGKKVSVVILLEQDFLDAWDKIEK